MAGRYALIVAGGTGQRMNSPVPKQFLPVHGKPVIAYTIEAFRQADAGVHLVIVLGRGNEQQWEAIRRTYFPDSEFLQAPGGNTRFQSVKNGLALVPNEGAVVAIHDAVRPCIDPEIIVKSFRQADEIGSAVVSVPVKDSIRVLSGDRSLAQDRSLYRLVQTPQVFRASWLMDAYQQEEKESFTDDASVVEHAGYPVHLLDGSYQNIKITTQEDLQLAAAYLKEKTLTNSGQG